MGVAYFYNPKKTGKEPPKPRYTPKGDGKDWSRELYATFRGTLILPEHYKPEWSFIHDCRGVGNPVNPEPEGEKHLKTKE
ncbi:hypothetical protein [Leptospira stimsonii]|uniref:Uncharacterized protein n=1 Tax=Leptospira stimsonii TaxID=2202203 RepID=A0ABY2MV20_9LEPT|nr:hypothetical protein [Leptospira stimsonii]TGK25390.1 hypothetical protein EHO98_03045 [Leptospira stimsonii]TGM08809.1 hypothetical protein EHQ90_22230 [Leptospira stimsonii]